MRILLVSPKNKTVFNFRGDLIKDMIACGNEVIVIGPNQEYVEDIYALGVSKFISLSFIKDNTSISGDLHFYKQLKAVIREEEPDMVFSYTIKPVIYGSLAASATHIKHVNAMVTGLGRIYAINGLKAKIIRFVTKRLYKKAFKACENVIFQNGEDLTTFVKQKYLPHAKARIVNGSGVNMKRKKKTPLPQDVTFLMIARIIKEKGVFDYCEAAKMVKERYPHARFVLLGGFDNSIGAIRPEDLRSYIENGIIEFPGETKDPVAYYQQSAVFVLPSYYGEGLPRTILEAMSCGRPVITTNWPGCREPIVDGENGFLVDINNPRQIAEKAILFIENRDRLEKMSQRSYEICKEKYDVGVVNLAMKSILKY